MGDPLGATGLRLVEDAGHGITVRLERYTSDGPRLVAAAARLSLSRKPLESLLAMGEGEVEEWIRETLRRAHFSPWEHSTYTWIAEGCTRVCTHQLVRHRIASYTQQSLRYTEGVLRELALEAGRLLGVECPPKPGRSQAERRAAYQCYHKALAEAAEALDGETLHRLAWKAFLIPRRPGLDPWETARAAVKAAGLYYRLLSLGAQREDARYVLPLMVRTRIIVTMNARELAQSFLPLRMCTRAQWEIRAVAWALHRLLNRVHPQLFRWTGPRCVLAENTSRGHPAPLSAYMEGREAFTIRYCPEQVPSKAIPACLRSAAPQPGKEREKGKRWEG